MNLPVRLREIEVDKIKPNPENPRLIFRQEEMDALLISIKKFGVQVPITVFEDRGRFILLDGERRWRTSVKLNLPKIPAIVVDKPTELDNLLMMFNIHSLREQWDYFTIANKLTRINELLGKQFGREPNERELSENTGLSRGTIRRCRLLIALPDRFKELLIDELRKPKTSQKLTEDFFIEMEQNLRTVVNNLPEAVDNIDRVRNVLVEKYEKGIIGNILDFRKVGKLATSPSNVAYGYADARSALAKIFSDNSNSIEEVFASSVGGLYGEKRLISSFNNILYYITNLNEEEQRDEEIRRTLLAIRDAIDRIVRTEEN